MGSLGQESSRDKDLMVRPSEGQGDLGFAGGVMDMGVAEHMGT